MVIGKVSRGNVLMHLTFDEEEAEEICESLVNIIEMGYNIVAMFGDPEWED